MFYQLLRLCASSILVASVTVRSYGQIPIFQWDDDNNSANKNWSNRFNWLEDAIPISTASVTIGNLTSAYNDVTLLDLSKQIYRLNLVGGADIYTSPDGGVTSFELDVSDFVTVDYGTNGVQ